MWCAAGVFAGGILVSGQIQTPEPRKQFGASITGAFEGWFFNPDGSRSFLVGYYNRNSQQAIDVPIGPNNRIEPSGPDLGQPTHFLPGRQWGMFVVPAPREFKPTDSYVWTIVANGQSTSIPLRLHPDYVMSPFEEIAVGNTPPVLQFEGAPASGTGPLGTKTSIKAVAGTPVTVKFQVTDDKKALPQKRVIGVRLTWARYRGAGAVTIGDFTKSVDGNGEANVTVTFAEPGEYVLRVEAMDNEIHDFHCCWSNGYIHATVAAR